MVVVCLLLKHKVSMFIGLACLDFSTQIRLALNSGICLPLHPECWD